MRSPPPGHLQELVRGCRRVELIPAWWSPDRDSTCALASACARPTAGRVPARSVKFGFDPGPLVVAFVLGALLEDDLRRSLLVFDGDVTGFVTRPISGALLVAFVLVLLLPLVQNRLARRAAARGSRDTENTEELV